MTKDDLIEKYRDINVDTFPWWDSIEENLESDMDALGFTMTKMYFSGFWSQGDGACFEGRMLDWTRFCDKVPEFVRDFPYLSEYLKDEGANYKVAHSGHYYHENCTTHEYSSELEYETEQLELRATHGVFGGLDEENLMRFALYSKALHEEATSTDTGVYDWLKDYFKDKMRELYRNLEEEYEHLTSDEAVWETIVANELDEELEEENAEETVCART